MLLIVLPFANHLTFNNKHERSVVSEQGSSFVKTVESNLTKDEMNLGIYTISPTPL